MAWVESHTVLIRHRKLKELARSLRLKAVYIMGHLHALWHDTLEQQEDGDLSSWSDELIAESSHFDGDAPQYVSLLQRHGWLDDRKIHDWLDYAGRYLESKYRTSNPARLEEIWKKHGRVYLQAASRQTKVSPPNLTLPDLPKDNAQASRLAAIRFDSIWQRYPRQLGRKAAERHFNSSVKTPQDWADINSALTNYITQIRREHIEPDFVKHGSTWFNNWRDYIKYKGVVIPPSPRQTPVPRPADVPPDVTDEDLRKMHDAKVEKLGRCRAKDCPYCSNAKDAARV